MPVILRSADTIDPTAIRLKATTYRIIIANAKANSGTKVKSINRHSTSRHSSIGGNINLVEIEAGILQNGSGKPTTGTCIFYRDIIGSTRDLRQIERLSLMDS